jgi:hypothetical protein
MRKIIRNLGERNSQSSKRDSSFSCSRSLILENASILGPYPSLKKFTSSFKFSDLGWAAVFFSSKIVCNQTENHPYEDVKKSDNPANLAINQI